IGTALATKDGWHRIAIRSTVLPGTIESIIIPILEEKSGKRADVDFAVCANPEFIREGTAVRDFFNPPFTVIGASDPQLSAPL
ncbi:GDP-mannose dehydrogenase, partial [Klebsiella pneumoniae]